MNAWACEASLVLGQLKVDEKTNEIKAIPELLDILCPKGCVMTIDAMGTQKETAEKIIDKEADYILQVKGDQESLTEDISLYFEKEHMDTYIYKCYNISVGGESMNSFVVRAIDETMLRDCPPDKEEYQTFFSLYYL